MLQKTAAFEKCFQKCQQHKGQSMSSWLRKRIQEWNALIDLTENTMMSEDLRNFFLKLALLSGQNRRQVLLANQADYPHREKSHPPEGKRARMGKESWIPAPAQLQETLPSSWMSLKSLKRSRIMKRSMILKSSLT